MGRGRRLRSTPFLSPLAADVLITVMAAGADVSLRPAMQCVPAVEASDEVVPQAAVAAVACGQQMHPIIARAASRDISPTAGAD